MKRSLFSTCSFRAYFIAYRLTLANLQMPIASAETKHVYRSLGIGLDSSSSISGLLARTYFLTPYIMEKRYYITGDSANIAVRALYCYKRLIGIGADLHGDLPDRALQKHIDFAINEIWSQASVKKQETSAKRPTTN